jgi:hypothetical protein
MPLTSIEVVLLAIDPALHTSGAAILIPDYGPMDDPHPFKGDYILYEFGKVVSQSERERYVESLLQTASEYELPAVVVAEIWDGPRGHDQKWTYETVLGIGEGWGRWSAEIEAANEYLREEGLPEVALERVLPNDWRDALFGRNRPKDTETLKATACRFFEGVFGYKASADISEAGCIGLYGLTAPAVAERATEQLRLTSAVKKPKKRRRKAS